MPRLKRAHSGAVSSPPSKKTRTAGTKPANLRVILEGELKDAIEAGNQAVELQESLALFTRGVVASADQQMSGVGLSFVNPVRNRTSLFKYKIGSCNYLPHAEMAAIAQAVWIAGRFVEKEGIRGMDVQVFTGSKACLQALLGALGPADSNQDTAALRDTLQGFVDTIQCLLNTELVHCHVEMRHLPSGSTFNAREAHFWACQAAEGKVPSDTWMPGMEGVDTEVFRLRNSVGVPRPQEKNETAANVRSKGPEEARDAVSWGGLEVGGEAWNQLKARGCDPYDIGSED